MPTANGGYYTDGKTVIPLRTGAASFVVYSDGTVDVGAWGSRRVHDPRRGVGPPEPRPAGRQRPARPRPQRHDTTQWGATLGDAVYVWRSGLGVTADGALVYVGGPGLNITDLANLLVRAGAVRAMELDINTDWVNFSHLPALHPERAGHARPTAPSSLPDDDRDAGPVLRALVGPGLLHHVGPDRSGRLISGRGWSGARAPPPTPDGPIASGGRFMERTLADDLVRWTRLDLAPRHRQPSWGRVAVGTVVSLVGSLVVDALLVAIGTRVFPSTKGFVHFQFHDYARLTVVGVLGACAGWPIVTRISSAPRWLYLRLAVLVTLVLLLPDLWIYLQGESARAVFVLVWMHLAIALVTYNAMVRIAPVRTATSAAAQP